MARSFSREVDSAIALAADRYGIDPEWMRQIARIESSGNPKAQTGSYAGLFQLSPEEFKRVGGKGSILDPKANSMAAASLLRSHMENFEKKYGRAPDLDELYLTHQQGWGGVQQHLQDPNRPAWESMLATSEGKARGEEWAKKAILGNLPKEAKRQFGENITSGQFRDVWRSRLGLDVPPTGAIQSVEGEGAEGPLPEPEGERPFAVPYAEYMKSRRPAEEPLTLQRSPELTVGTVFAPEPSKGPSALWESPMLSPAERTEAYAREFGELRTPGERPRDVMAPVAEAISPTMGGYDVGQALGGVAAPIIKEGRRPPVEDIAMLAAAIPPGRIAKPVRAARTAGGALEDTAAAFAKWRERKGAEAAAKTATETYPALQGRNPLDVLKEIGGKWEKATVLDAEGNVVFNPIGEDWRGEGHRLAVQIMPDGSVKKGFIAYHGSPYDFDKFSKRKIGTGEGEQAFGYGLYFAGEEAVSETYRGLPGNLRPQDIPDYTAKAALTTAKGDKDKAIENLRRRLAEWHASTGKKLPEYDKKAMDAIEALQSGRVTEPLGKMYQVKVRGDPDDYLNWDEPVSAQSPKIQEAFTKAYRELEKRPGFKPTYSDMDPDYWTKRILRENKWDVKKSIEEVKERIAWQSDPSNTDTPRSKAEFKKMYGKILADYESGRRYDPLGELLEKPAGEAYQRLSSWASKESEEGWMEADPAGVSDALLKQGIPGIRYFDQPSRKAGKGTSNYVVFDDETVAIMKKYGLLPPMVAGALTYEAETGLEFPGTARSPEAGR